MLEKSKGAEALPHLTPSTFASLKHEVLAGLLFLSVTAHLILIPLTLRREAPLPVLIADDNSLQ